MLCPDLVLGRFMCTHKSGCWEGSCVHMRRLTVDLCYRRFADDDIEKQVSELRAKLLKQNAAVDSKKEYVF